MRYISQGAFCIIVHSFNLIAQRIHKMKPPQKNAKTIAREVDGEAILLNEEKEEIHQLNQTTSFIWECCNGKNTIDDIVELLNNKFQTESIDIRTDVINIITTLKELDLIEE